MQERFTDRARKSMQLARQEAQRLGHCDVDCSHLLLGLLKEGSGVAANVLKNFGFDLRHLRNGLEATRGAGMSSEQNPKPSQALESALEAATAESKALGHLYVGTEHLLLGLIRDETNSACGILKWLNVNFDAIRKETLNLLGDPEKGVSPDVAEKLKALAGDVAFQRLVGDYGRTFSAPAGMTVIQQGIPLRDYFAGQAIVGILSINCDPVVDRCAQLAFEVADAMLKEHERHQAPAGVPSDPASTDDLRPQSAG